MNGIFLLLIVALIAGYDIFIIKKHGKKASLSAWIIRSSYKYPSFVAVSMLALGITLGHLMWRMKSLNIYECSSPEIIEITNTCKEGVK